MRPGLAVELWECGAGPYQGGGRTPRLNLHIPNDGRREAGVPGESRHRATRADTTCARFRSQPDCTARAASARRDRMGKREALDPL